jgi:predicted chitinase
MSDSPVLSHQPAQLQSAEPQELEGGVSMSPPQFKLSTESGDDGSQGGDGTPTQLKENQNSPATQLKAENESAQPKQLKAPAFSLSASPAQMKQDEGGNVLGKMGQAMGEDFSGVNIHANSSQASDMGALAYAQGNDVHFAPGQYNPTSTSGQELIGHELAHVKQQREGRVQANNVKDGTPINDDRSLEKEADTMGAKAAQFKADPSAAQAPATSGKSSDGPVQRKAVAQLAGNEKFENSNTAVANIALIKAEWDALGDKNNHKLAYILATVEHECGFHSREEVKQVKDDTQAQKDLIATQSKYWDTGFYGRGFVQLTHKSNYEKMGTVVGQDLVKSPELALEPKNAAKITVYGMIHGSFTGKSLSDYFTDKTNDNAGARKIINGTDKKDEIALKAEAHYTRLSGTDGGKTYYETYMNLFDMQQVLKDEGFLKGTVDGMGGGDTNQAIKAFKVKYKLPEETSPKLNDETKAKLLEIQTARIGTADTKAATFDPDKFWKDNGAESSAVATAAIKILPSRSADVLALLKALPMSSDNVSFYIVEGMALDKLKGLDKDLLVYMRAAMDGGWTDYAEYEAMGKIDLAIDGKAADEKAAKEKPATTPVVKPGPETKPAAGPKPTAPVETVESVYKSVEGDYPKLGALLAGKLTTNPKLVKDMFAYVNYLFTDDLAYYITLSATDAALAATEKPLITKMYQAMDGDWTTTDEYKMMAKLKPYYTGEVEKAPAAGGGAPKDDGKEKFVVSDGKAYLRDDKFEKLPGDKTIPKWTEVIVEKTATSGKSTYSYVTSVDGATKWGWTASSNLYSLKFDAKGHEKELKAVSSSYYDMLAGLDLSRDGLALSGTGAIAKVDALYPNQTDPKYLDKDFRAKMDVMLAGWKTNGIHATANAGLRHPMRSVVFNYCLAISASATEDKIHEANAVCTKYGIPVDWAHKKEDGTIDLVASKKGAQEMKTKYKLNKKAARGVTDFGGTVSNHNVGKAVDLTLSFDFSEKKDITVNGTVYSVTPSVETPALIADVGSTALSKMGKEQYGLTRAIDDDTMHWSYKGN